MFDVVIGQHAVAISAISGQSETISGKGSNDMTLFAVKGGWEEHKDSPRQWQAVGKAQFKQAKKQTRLVLSQPLRAEAGERVGLYLHTPDSNSGVGYHDGDASPVQGEGLVIHKGVRTRYDELSSMCHSNLFTLEFIADQTALVETPAGEQSGAGAPPPDASSTQG